jgi:alpha-tubulin suppressor-like RCC1 family protein
VFGGFEFTDLRAGEAHTCAITRDSAGYCWGVGANNRLGTGALLDRAQPTAIAGTLEWLQPAAGGAHGCGIVSGPNAYCWGKNQSGQLGNGSISNAPTPRKVIG